MKYIASYWAIVERSLLVVVLLVMILLAVTQIVLRNFVGISLFWIDPLNRLLVLWLALLGAMVATRERGHISIDILRHYTAKPWFGFLQRLVNLVSALICALVAFHSARFVYDEFVFQTTTFSNLPAWPFQIIMPLGFFVMALRFFYALVVMAKPIADKALATEERSRQ